MTDPGEVRTVDEVIRGHVEAVLAACGGRVAVAAPLLGVCAKTVYNWLNRWASEDRMRSGRKGV